MQKKNVRLGHLVVMHSECNAFYLVSIDAFAFVFSKHCEAIFFVLLSLLRTVYALIWYGVLVNVSLSIHACSVENHSTCMCILERISYTLL